MTPTHCHLTGLRRREFLQVGFSGLLGLEVSAVLGAESRAVGSTSVPSRPRRAKAVILVFLTGGPSHIDTFDLKPKATLGVRGDFRPIATKAPGVQICEHLPRLACHADKLAIVRTLSHREKGHLMATHKALTGNVMTNAPDGSGIDKIASRDDFPCYAAALDSLRPRGDGIPSGVSLPTHLVEGPLVWPGQNAGFLGPQHDPWQVTQDPNDPSFRQDSLTLPLGFSVGRLRERQILLDQIDRQRARLLASAAAQPFARQQELACSMLTSGKVARAFDLKRETDACRERYGRHLFGQSLLLARRLVQAGVPVVQANMGIVQTWDTHAGNFPRLKDQLLPPLDRGISALLEDLAALGLLDETLVVITGEFGRTPKIGVVPGQSAAGRDHWASVFSAVFAGAGVRGGQTIGQSDQNGAFPATRPYSPSDLGATVYQALGLDPKTDLRDRLGRPIRLCPGTPIEALSSGANG